MRDAGHSEHPESVKRIEAKCGCVTYRCFKCRTGVKAQCRKCGGKMVFVK